MALILDDHELRLLTQFPFTEHGRVLMKIVEAEHSQWDADLKEHPRFDDEDVTRDLRYRLGSIRRLEWLRDAPKRAEEELQHREKGGNRR